MITRAVLFALALLCLTAGPAVAQRHDAPSAASSESYRDSGSARSKSDEWMIPPGKTGTLGLEFAFMTARGPLSFVLGAPELLFTDVVFLRMQGRYSLGGVAELIVDTSLLPKQPSYTDELVFQNAGLGFRVGITKWLAAILRLDGGSTLFQSGIWGTGALGLQGRFPIEDYVQFDLSLSGAGTAMFIDEEAPRFFEIGAGGQVVFFAPGIAAGWIGTDFHFPLAAEGTSSWPIDPRVRVGFNVGAVLSSIDKWDLYAKYSYIDRGDLIDPDTTLPILDGGFDQQMLTFGIVRRFGDEPSGNY